MQWTHSWVIIFIDKGVHINPLLILKLLYTICKCNHTEWPHVGLYGSEKAFRKIGLFPLISLSTASPKTKNWELTLPWMSRRWLRYLAIEIERGSWYWKKNLFWGAAALSYLTRCQFPCFQSPPGVIFAPTAAERRSFSNNKQPKSCKFILCSRYAKLCGFYYADPGLRNL